MILPDDATPEQIIEHRVKEYEDCNSSVNHFASFWTGLGAEVTDALKARGYYYAKRDLHPAAAEGELKTYTFESWITEHLQDVDPEVVVRPDGMGRLSVLIHGDWNIATVYAPPTELLPLFLDQHPRELQTEMFRWIIFSINSWFGYATDVNTGDAVKP